MKSFFSISRITFLIAITSLAIVSSQCSGSQDRPIGPVDIYNASGVKAVTAHSTTRSLSSTYDGPLYQVKRKSDRKTLDIGTISGGIADAMAQDEFCEATTCWITRIYDQSGNGNDLMQAPPGTFVGPAVGGFNELPIADMAPATVNGKKVYGAFIMPGMGLRNNDAQGLAINDEPQGIYMVFDGTHFDSGCCFNYGNTSTNSRAVGRGTMATVYFGTATAWGKGEGEGPWIMSDMEAGLFSGYETKENAANPTIDGWRFVTGMVSGGGGNQWEINGGNAQNGELTNFYKGIRPQSKENDNYYPMHRKGSVQMGNGGDNGNGSAGTFYEGVMTYGYPDEATLAAVQANIVAANYGESLVSLSRTTTFTPGTSQTITQTFTNSSGATANDVKVTVDVPEGWLATVSGTDDNMMVLEDALTAGEQVEVSFTITSPASADAGYLTGTVEWTDETGEKRSEINTQRIRNTAPVKINEVRFTSSDNPTNQFVELYNASDSEADISNWSIVNTRSEWAPVILGTIPNGTVIPSKGFYLLGLAQSGLAAPAKSGETTINVYSTDGFEAGQQIEIDGEEATVKSVGSAAAEMTTIFVPVSTGPWLTIPEGSTNIPVTNADGFEEGQKIGIDLGGNYEIATVTEVGKASTQSNLAEPAKVGDTILKIWDTHNMTEGDVLTINTGARVEEVTVKSINKVVVAPARGTPEEPGEVEITAPLEKDHMLAVDVASPGTGITFSPATQYSHKSGEAVQVLGSGITLESPLANDHTTGEPVVNPQAQGGFEGAVSPDQWYGFPLSIHAGSITLKHANDDVVVDAMIYGSQQGNSSADGTITSPEIAILEGDQDQGGCIAVIPGATARYFRRPSSDQVNISLGRYPDGSDMDSNCSDFVVQSKVNLVLPASAGASNIKVASVEGLEAGQQIIIDTEAKSETATIKAVGSTGGTKTAAATPAGATSIAVESAGGFDVGQTIVIDSGGKREQAVVASLSVVRRFSRNAGNESDSIRIEKPLAYSHSSGVELAGSGITLSSSLKMNHGQGVQVADASPTPGKPNLYAKKP